MTFHYYTIITDITLSIIFWICIYITFYNNIYIIYIYISNIYIYITNIYIYIYIYIYYKYIYIYIYIYISQKGRQETDIETNCGKTV